MRVKAAFTRRATSRRATGYSPAVRNLPRVWFGLTDRVDRSTYLLHGAALMALKLGVDVVAVFAVTGRLWTPIDYLTPVLSARGGHLHARPQWLLLAMAVWTLPFLWIGISMSLRRALDAGLSPWIALLFFVPFVNWGLISALAIVPSRPRPAHATPTAGTDRLRAALLGVGAGTLIGASCTASTGGSCATSRRRSSARLPARDQIQPSIQRAYVASGRPARAAPAMRPAWPRLRSPASRRASPAPPRCGSHRSGAEGAPPRPAAPRRSG